MAEGGDLPQQPPGPGGSGLRPGRGRRYRRSGHRAFAQRSGAAGTEELVELTSGQHKQEPFADGLGALALGAVKLAGGEFAKLLLHLTSRLCAAAGFP
jgi:hypothetical protein